MGKERREKKEGREEEKGLFMFGREREVCDLST